MLDFKHIAFMLSRNPRDPSFYDPVFVEGSKWLIDHKILMQAGFLNKIPCPCNRTHMAFVERISGIGEDPRFLAYCEESGFSYEVEQKEVIKWRISIQAIFHLIQNECGCQDKPLMVCKDLWYLGESDMVIAGRRRQIYFSTEISKEVEASLPKGITPILILAQLIPPASEAFKDRIFLMHEIMRLDEIGFRFDLDLIRSRLQSTSPGEPKKPAPVLSKRDLVKQEREKIILDFLNNRAECLRDLYWQSTDPNFKLPSRPSCNEIAGYIAAVTEGRLKPDHTTVGRTLKTTENPKLRKLWKKIDDISYIKNYGRSNSIPMLEDGESRSRTKKRKGRKLPKAQDNRNDSCSHDGYSQESPDYSDYDNDKESDSEAIDAMFSETVVDLSEEGINIR